MSMGEIIWEGLQVACILYCLMGFAHFCQKERKRNDKD